MQSGSKDSQYCFRRSKSVRIKSFTMEFEGTVGHIDDQITQGRVSTRNVSVLGIRTDVFVLRNVSRTSPSTLPQKLRHEDSSSSIENEQFSFFIRVWILINLVLIYPSTLYFASCQLLMIIGLVCMAVALSETPYVFGFICSFCI